MFCSENDDLTVNESAIFWYSKEAVNVELPYLFLNTILIACAFERTCSF